MLSCSVRSVYVHEHCLSQMQESIIPLVTQTLQAFSCKPLLFASFFSDFLFKGFFKCGYVPARDTLLEHLLFGPMLRPIPCAGIRALLLSCSFRAPPSLQQRATFSLSLATWVLPASDSFSNLQQPNASSIRTPKLHRLHARLEVLLSIALPNKFTNKEEHLHLCRNHTSNVRPQPVVLERRNLQRDSRRGGRRGGLLVRLSERVQWPGLRNPVRGCVAGTVQSS